MSHLTTQPEFGASQEILSLQPVELLCEQAEWGDGETGKRRGHLCSEDCRAVRGLRLGGVPRPGTRGSARAPFHGVA